MILFLTGLYDDRFDMHSVVKLMLQICAGAAMYFMDGGISTIFDYTLPGYIALPLSILWTIGIVNAFNLIDGLDGLDGLAAGLGDAFGVVGAVHEQRDQVRLRIGEVLARDLDQVARDVGLHLVDLLFVGLQLFEFLFVDVRGAEMVVDRAVDHAPGEFDHLADLDDGAGKARQ